MVARCGSHQLFFIHSFSRLSSQNTRSKLGTITIHWIGSVGRHRAIRSIRGNMAACALERQ